MSVEGRLAELKQSQRLDDSQGQKLASYLKILSAWNKRLDLVSPGSELELLERHLADGLASIACLEPELRMPNPRILDVGSGAGLPGIVWAIVKPKSEIVLLEPREKRSVFLKEVVSRLELSNTRVVSSRLEELESEPNFDVLTSRALGRGEQLLASGAQILAPEGIVAELLGPNEGEGLELRASKAPELGYVSRETLSYELGKGRGHRLIFVARRPRSLASH